MDYLILSLIRRKCDLCKGTNEMRLYKYIRALETINNSGIRDSSEIIDISKKLEATVKESKLFFSHPASFNDPLECTIPITIDNYDINREKYLSFCKSFINKRIGNSSSESERKNRVNEMLEYGMPLENCLVTCFTKDGNNQLMWAHYADQNKGICLCYEFPETIEDFKEQVIWSEMISSDINNWGLEVQCNSVDYRIKRPSLHVSNTSLSVDKWTFDNDYILGNAIFTKPQCWVYEQEWRLALILPLGGKIAFGVGMNTSDYYAVLPREWLKEVIFGLRLKKEYCEKIKNLFKSSGYSGVEFKKAKMAHGEFRIIIEQY